MPARTKLAQLIARKEGFGIPGALPTRRNNPGDLRHSLHGSHAGDPNAIAQEPDEDTGWSDLERQLQLYSMRRMTLGQMVAIYAPPNENDSEEYLNFICTTLAMRPDTLVSDALRIPASGLFANEEDV